MIYLCQTCGWSINSRYRNKNLKPEEIGKHLLYNNKPFCSNDCIEIAKTKPYILLRQVQPADWDDENYKLNGMITNWRIQRKLNRVKRKKNKL